MLSVKYKIYSPFLFFFICLCNINIVICDEQCDDNHKCHIGSKCIKVALGQNNYNLCICKPGFTGWDCSIPLDYCNKHCRPLQRGISCKHTLCNQGQCINQDSHPYYRCDCGAFYKGDNCEIEDNPCSYERNNPCGNGDCEFIPGVNQINCKCHPGWTKNPNQPNTKYTWNGVEVHMTAACLEELKKGITGSAPILGPSKLDILLFSLIDNPDAKVACYSEGDLTIVNNCPKGQLRFGLDSGCNVEEDVFTTGLENINFIVKTFETNDSNSSESTKATELNEHQFLDEFDESYFSMVNSKMDSLEGKTTAKSYEEKKDISDKNMTKICSILGDVWIAELNFPADIPLFKKLVTNAVYTMYPDKIGSNSESTSRLSMDGLIHNGDASTVKSKKYSRNVNFSKPNKTNFSPTKNDTFKDIHNAKLDSKELNPNVDSTNTSLNLNHLRVNEKDSVFTLGKNRFPALNKHRIPNHITRDSLTPSSHSSEFSDGFVEEVSREGTEAYNLNSRKYNNEKLKDKMTTRDGISYLKTERFNDILSQCPFFSGHKANNAETSDKKARLIIHKLIEDAEKSKSRSSKYLVGSSKDFDNSKADADKASMPGYAQDQPPTSSQQSKPTKRRSRRKTRRLYTSRPKYLMKRSRHKSRRVFLQKLNFLVDRMTSEFINKKKYEILCDEFFRRAPGVNDYITGVDGWKYDPYFLNCQGSAKGHGVHLSSEGFRAPRELESSLRDPFKIPSLSTDRISHREIVKRMLQEY